MSTNQAESDGSDETDETVGDLLKGDLYSGIDGLRVESNRVSSGIGNEGMRPHHVSVECRKLIDSLEDATDLWFDASTELAGLLNDWDDLDEEERREQVEDALDKLGLD